MDDDAPNSGDYVEYSYDCWDRLIAKTRHISTDTYTVSHQYDEANRVEKLTYPDDMEILYSYDDLNRTTEIKRYVDGSNDEILMDGIQYNTENLLTQFDVGNDLRTTFSYDSRNRLSTLDLKDGATSFLDLDYTYDDGGNITQLINGWRDTDTDWNSDTESYSYDGLGRLTSGSCNAWSHSYSYDKVGNIASKDSVTYTLNSVNEVTSLSDGTSFTYDSNGNRTQKTKGVDTWDYTYDYANRLIELEENETTIGTYVYDGDGGRLQVTENSVTTTYINNGSDIIYEENANSTTTYIYGPTGRLARRTTINQSSNTYYYHTDLVSSTRLVTDSSKNIVAAVTYHPFGSTSTIEGTVNYLFTGKEKDSTGLYYYGARYYDPGTGRFLTRDPYTSLPDDSRVIGSSGGIFMSSVNAQDLNRYSYAGNNPLKFNDPTGLCSVCGGIGYEVIRANLFDLDPLHTSWLGLKEFTDSLGGHLGRILGLSGFWGYLSGGGSTRNCYAVVHLVCEGEEPVEIGEPCYWTPDGSKEEKAKRDKCLGDVDSLTAAKNTVNMNKNCEYVRYAYCGEDVVIPTPAPPPEETDDTCIGSFLLCIFVGLTGFAISLISKT
jgi:RHS repeat-associated protein